MGIHFGSPGTYLTTFAPLKGKGVTTIDKSEVFMHAVIPNTIMLLCSHYLLLKYKDLSQINIPDHLQLMSMMQDPRIPKDVVSNYSRSILSLVILCSSAPPLLCMSHGRAYSEALMIRLLI